MRAMFLVDMKYFIGEKKIVDASFFFFPLQVIYLREGGGRGSVYRG